LTKVSNLKLLVPMLGKEVLERDLKKEKDLITH
jgi:hypothetical protein